MLKIVQAPDPVLTKPTQPVGIINQRIKDIITHMKETILAKDENERLIRVGLAAPQVGLSLSMFLMKPDDKSDIEVWINPQILETKFPRTKPAKKIKKKKKQRLEGCLSVHNVWAPVKRAPQILVSYQTENGEKKRMWVRGFRAIIIQHEIDHLQGILFTQRALEQNVPLYEENDGKLNKLEY